MYPLATGPYVSSRDAPHTRQREPCVMMQAARFRGFLSYRFTSTVETAPSGSPTSSSLDGSADMDRGNSESINAITPPPQRSASESTPSGELGSTSMGVTFTCSAKVLHRAGH